VHIDHLVIPAAGLGTRVKAVSGGLPKEMLDIGDRPAIRYAVEEGLSAGIRNIAIIISREKEVIRQYLEESDISSQLSSGGVKLSFFYQDKPLGEAGAISLTEDFVGGNPLAIFYPDNIFLPSCAALKSIKRAFEDCSRNLISLVEVTDETSSGLGASGHVDLTLLEGNLFRVDRVYPKGRGYFKPRYRGELRGCGLWLVGSDFFSHLHRARQEAQGGEFTDGAVKNLILREEGLYGLRLPGICFDIGNPEGYRLCKTYMSAASSTELDLP
jgi:UTP--glucose-1-phosphate uridylyltransferase